MAWAQVLPVKVVRSGLILNILKGELEDFAGEKFCIYVKSELWCLIHKIMADGISGT